MSDCATVVFFSRIQRTVSPAVYLHHHGGCVLNFLESALPVMRSGDPEYSCARFTGFCHGAIPPNVSLGVFNLYPMPSISADDRSDAGFEQMMEKAKASNRGGRGIFLVDVDRWTVKHAGSLECPYGDIGEGFDLQEATELRPVNGTVRLPADKAGR
jgi:hypothetical protein